VADVPGSSAAEQSTTPKLFVRQSSGLVRNVSVTNALFFNVAAFVGVGLTLYPVFGTHAVPGPSAPSERHPNYFLRKK
jgi:hypothetical protein